MYASWPFFRATIDNAELALAKADLGIMREYFALSGDDSSLTAIADEISEEHQRSRKAIVEISGNEDLLAGIPWLSESIRVRNRFIDPLNLVQVELMHRELADEAVESEERRHLMRLTINGIASGMRTSG